MINKEFIVSTDEYGLYQNAEQNYIMKALDEDYPYVLNPCCIKVSHEKALVARLKKDFDPTCIIDLVSTHNRLIIRTDEVFVYVKADNRMALFATNTGLEDLQHYIVKYSEFFSENLDEEGRDLTCYYNSARGLSSVYCKADVEEFAANIIPELSPNIDIHKLVNSFIDSNSKILLLYGPPGTGKTTILKYMISLPHFKRIAYCKDMKILEGNEAWITFQGNNHDLLLLDDLDIELSPRDKGGNPFVSNLLTYTDGVLTNETKVVITTNLPMKGIDSALLRPGRCYDVLKLGPLDIDLAKYVWINILKHDEDSFVKYFAEAVTISQAELIETHVRVKGDTAVRPYVTRGNNIYGIEQKVAQLGISTGVDAGGYFGNKTGS